MTSPNIEKRQNLFGIQALRGVAASLVVLAHLQSFQTSYFPQVPHLHPGLVICEAGVDLFFVISGFVMTYITPEALCLGRRQAAFCIRRFIRIYPIYWATAFSYLAINRFLHGNQIGNKAPPFDFSSSILLLPRVGTPFLAVSWSLTYELYFYLVISFLFCSSKKWRMLFLLLWAATVLIGWSLHPYPALSPYWTLIFSPLNLEFIAGALLAHLHKTRPVVHPTFAWVGLVLALAVAIGGGFGFIVFPTKAWFAFAFTGCQP